MKKMKKRVLALTMAVLMVLMLAACSVSSSSTTTTSVSTSKTDENGNTTTTTTTTTTGTSSGSDGVTTTNETTTETTTTSADEADEADEAMTPEEEAAELTDRMYSLYTGGGKGVDEDGNTFYFAFNEENDNLMIALLDADHSQFLKYHGYLDELEDGQSVLTGYYEGDYIPYNLENGEDGFFTITFPQNGDVVEMELMDYDEFVEDFVAEWVNFEN